jgi:ABC transport system ATP-binding/permease protein
MTPLSEILALLKTTTAKSFADRHANHDLILLEPYEKDRAYTNQAPLHSGGKVQFLSKTVGKPVPVGRDARSVVLLDHPAVSRLHIVLAYTAQGWKVMDRSSNGSWLNEVRMTKDQAVPVVFGMPLRMGRALVCRLFSLEAFHDYARAVSQSGLAPPQPTADPQADTWRFPSVPRGAPTQRLQRPAPPAPPPAGGFAPAAPAAPGPNLDIDFEFGNAPPAAPAAPTAPGGQRQNVSDGDMEFDFDFDFDGDNRGGFA